MLWTQIYNAAVEYHELRGRLSQTQGSEVLHIVEYNDTVVEYYDPQLDSNTQQLTILSLQTNKDSEFSIIHEKASLRALSILGINTKL